MSKPKVLIIQTGGTVAQEMCADGEYRPCPRDYLPLIRGINAVEDSNLRSTPECVVQDEVRKYIMRKSHISPEIEIDAIQTKNIDSTEMEQADRSYIARLIYQNAYDYEGFVVVHGTDTMTDTAASLSLMLRDLNKPIVLTGAQRSMYDLGPDADSNIIDSIRTATLDLGEVVIAFGDKIIRGNRAVKTSEQGLIAFNSPRLPPLGEIGIGIILRDHRRRREDRQPDPIPFFDFETKIEYYEPKSGTQTNAFEKGYINNDEVKGIVFGAYGAGNIHPRYHKGIAQALELGKPVVVVTSCLEGAADMGIYAVGVAPLKKGALAAGDMTKEAVTQKTMYILGRLSAEGVTGTDILPHLDRLLKVNYADEITITQTRFRGSYPK